MSNHFTGFRCRVPNWQGNWKSPHWSVYTSWTIWLGGGEGGSWSLIATFLPAGCKYLNFPTAACQCSFAGSAAAAITARTSNVPKLESGFIHAAGSHAHHTMMTGWPTRKGTAVHLLNHRLQHGLRFLPNSVRGATNAHLWLPRVGGWWETSVRRCIQRLARKATKQDSLVHTLCCVKRSCAEPFAHTLT